MPQEDIQKTEVSQLWRTNGVGKLLDACHLTVNKIKDRGAFIPHGCSEEERAAYHQEGVQLIQDYNVYAQTYVHLRDYEQRRHPQILDVSAVEFHNKKLRETKKRGSVVYDELLPIMDILRQEGLISSCSPPITQFETDTSQTASQLLPQVMESVGNHNEGVGVQHPTVVTNTVREPSSGTELLSMAEETVEMDLGSLSIPSKPMSGSSGLPPISTPAAEADKASGSLRRQKGSPESSSRLPRKTVSVRTRSHVGDSASGGSRSIASSLRRVQTEKARAESSLQLVQQLQQKERQLHGHGQQQELGLKEKILDIETQRSQREAREEAEEAERAQREAEKEAERAQREALEEAERKKREAKTESERKKREAKTKGIEAEERRQEELLQLKMRQLNESTRSEIEDERVLGDLTADLAAVTAEVSVLEDLER